MEVEENRRVSEPHEDRDEAARTLARIRLLPAIVRDQIAAGEVVERPASVVKEVVENALDAGAGRIQVDLEEGGAKLIRVVDDGCGMAAADLELAFASHATSKLGDVADLDHIATLGFRGEALASIASIARCRILSRPPGDEVGNEIRSDGGRIGDVTAAGAPQGTTVEVRDLFFNTPARRRFLKRPSTELGHALDILQRLALAHVGTAFVVTHDGRRVLDVEAGMDLGARVRRLFGAELADALVPVEGQDGDTRLTGLVAPPRFSRRDTQRQMWFLNGRALRDRVLTRALREGYRGFLVEGRQPIAFLSLAMDPGAVDVNVHPTKSEVRFHEQRRLFGFIVHTLREAVRQTDMSTPGESLLGRLERRGAWTQREHLPDPGPTAPTRPGAEPLAVFEVPGRPLGGLAGAGASRDSADGPQTPAAPASPDAEAWERRDEIEGPFLQVAKTYLIRAVPDGFEIVDQHALHERLTFEGLRTEVRRGRVEVQRLLVPELVEVSRAEASLLEEHVDALARIGIELSAFGPTTVAVSGLPARLRHPDADGLVKDLIDVIERTGSPPDAEDVLEEVLHRTACRSSIMAGDALSQDEIRALLARARELETDQTCPHARPTRVRFSLADLEKAFHRR